MVKWKRYVQKGLMLCGILILTVWIVGIWKNETVLTENNKGTRENLHEDFGGPPPEKMKQPETEDVKPKIALTFDDGPHPVFTPKLLDGLKERGVKASFFVVGGNIKGHEDIIKRMSEEGHVIGNHTYSHVNLCQMTAEKACGELAKTDNEVRKITGKGTEYVRPPFGVWNDQLDCRITMMPVMWNIDPLDWKTYDAAAVTNRVVTKAKENAIILLHDYYESSVDAALRIVDELQAKGYRFVTVEEILLE